jgi:M6 family metalloprotease-like protein
MLLVMILLHSSVYTAHTAGETTLEDCRKPGNNSLGTATRFEDGGHIQDWSNFLKPKGKIKTLIIPIDFSDAPHASSLDSILTFGNKVSQEFERLSDSIMSLEITTTTSWIRMPREGKYYLTAIWTQKINDALDAANPSVDFSKYDLVLIKVDEKNSPIDSAGALPMWGENLGDGIKVLRGAFLGNDFWTKNGQGIQVAVHEIAHVFGLADLYQQNSDGQFSVGIFDLMSTFRPQYGLNLLGWNKWKLGWLDESKLKCVSNTSPMLLTFPLDKQKWNPVFMPYQDKVIGIELWSDVNSPESVSALFYEVSPKTYVWASNRESGKISPIQMLRPTTAARDSKVDSVLNLSAKFASGEFVENYGQKFRFVGKGKNNFYISITPLGKTELEIPSVDLQTPIATPTATPTASPVPVVTKSATTNKKTTITCVKGKLIKKVMAVKPKCPSGYKVKK